MYGIQELFICPYIHNRHYAIRSIEHCRVLAYRFIPVQYAVSSQTGLLSAAECIEAGIYSQSGLMTSFNESLKIIPIRAALHTCVDTINPRTHKIHLRTFVCLVQDITTSTCRPYINNNVGKTTVSDLCHIACDILLTVTVIREVGVTFNPYERTFLSNGWSRVLPFIRKDRYRILFLTGADCKQKRKCSQNIFH